MRSYNSLSKNNKIGLLCSLFTIGGLFGFIYEFIFYYVNGGCNEFYYRGYNFLPWISIYGIGALLIYFLTNRFKNKPIIVFVLSTLICGLLEYLVGKIILECFNTRYWDYNVEILNFGNIEGIICLRSVLFFGISGLLLMCVIVPLVLRLLKNKWYYNFICIITIIIFIDFIYNLLGGFIGLPIAKDIYESIGVKYVNFSG